MPDIDRFIGASICFEFDFWKERQRYQGDNTVSGSSLLDYQSITSTAA